MKSREVLELNKLKEYFIEKINKAYDSQNLDYLKDLIKHLEDNILNNNNKDEKSQLESLKIQSEEKYSKLFKRETLLKSRAKISKSRNINELMEYENQVKKILTDLPELSEDKRMQKVIEIINESKEIVTTIKGFEKELKEKFKVYLINMKENDKKKNQEDYEERLELLAISRRYGISTSFYYFCLKFWNDLHKAAITLDKNSVYSLYYSMLR
jgi:hypothetical protein